MNWEIFKGRVFCINLKERADRLQDVSAALAKVGLLDYTEFYHAERSNISGAVGCWTSHITVMRMARDRGLDWALIFEDDLLFDEGIMGNIMDKLIAFLPEFLKRTDWGNLFLGHAPVAGEAPIHTDGEFRVYRTCTTLAHAYIVNLKHNPIKDLINEPLPTEDKIEAGKSIYHIDHRFADTTEQYAIYPMFIFQRPESGTDNDWGYGEIFRTYTSPSACKVHEDLVIKTPLPIFRGHMLNCIPHTVMRLLPYAIFGRFPFF